MYLGYCFYSDVVRSTDQETNAIEQIACYLQFPRRGDTVCHAMQGHMGSTSVGQEEEGVEENVVFIVTCVERNGQGRVAKLSKLKIA